VLQEAGAIRECEEHGWMQERADPHARERAFDIARQDPPAGVSPDAAAAEVRDVLNSIGDTCPEFANALEVTTDYLLGRTALSRCRQADRT
jgi:hypothetical protein